MDLEEEGDWDDAQEEVEEVFNTKEVLEPEGD